MRKKRTDESLCKLTDFFTFSEIKVRKIVKRVETVEVTKKLNSDLHEELKEIKGMLKQILGFLSNVNVGVYTPSAPKFNEKKKEKTLDKVSNFQPATIGAGYGASHAELMQELKSVLKNRRGESS